MLATASSSLLILYSNQWLLLSSAFILGYIILEPESPLPPWIELSFYTCAILSCLLFFTFLYPRGRLKWKRRLQRVAFLIGGILLWQSIIAYYPYLYYRSCPQRWKLWNWAFNEGVYQCPPPSEHHISLKYALEVTSDFAGSLTHLFAVPFIVLYRKFFGGGWLNPFAWGFWILFYCTTTFLGFVYVGGSVKELISAVAQFVI